jgi:hypothetical protein
VLIDTIWQNANTEADKNNVEQGILHGRRSNSLSATIITIIAMNVGCGFACALGMMLQRVRYVHPLWKFEIWAWLGTFCLSALWSIMATANSFGLPTRTHLLFFQRYRAIGWIVLNPCCLLRRVVSYCSNSCVCRRVVRTCQIARLDMSPAWRLT